MNPNTLLLRQIHPSWVREGRVTSQAFKPTPKDDRKLSVSNGDMVSPRDSWMNYIKRNLASHGVLAVSVLECAKHDLEVSPDPLLEQQDHTVIDFSTLNSISQMERISKILTAYSFSRGWLFLPVLE